ncbi:hypothetical protein GCM10027168_53770 [Streptomyces capparidis]
MRVTREIRALMADGDPAAGAVADRRRAEADLEAIMASPAAAAGPERRRGRLVPALTAAAVAAVAAAVVAVSSLSGPGGSPGVAVPEPLSAAASGGDRPAAEVLREIKRRSAAGPAGTQPADPQPRLLQQRWTLAETATADGGPPESRPVTEEVEFAPQRDGSAVERVRRSPGGTTTHRLTAAQLAADPFAQRPPAGGEAFTSWLRAAHGGGDLRDPHVVEECVAMLLGRQYPGPAQRAALLDVIGGIPGLRYDGEVTDRAGRAGEAFSATRPGEGGKKRYTFVVSPVTGQVLGVERTLTEPVEDLDVRLPAVIGYVTYLDPVTDADRVGTEGR